MVNNTIIISIVGFPGVGKTTLINLLKNKYSNWIYNSSELPKELKLRISKYHGLDFTNKYFNIQSLYLNNSLLQINNLNNVIENNQENKICILDRGFEDTWCISEYFSEKKYFKLHKLKQKNSYWKINKLYFSDIIFFLYANHNVLAARVNKRDEYLKLSKRSLQDTFMQEMSLHYLKWYQNKSNVIFIDTTDLNPEEVSLKIINNIRMHIDK